MVSLALLTRVAEDSSIWLVPAAHVLLMVSLAAVFTPVFTLGLGARPAHLYSHGSSLLGALQQVAAAVGTAVAVSVLSARSAELARAGADPARALVGGLQWACGVCAVLCVVVLALALLLPARAEQMVEVGAAAADHDEDSVPEPV